MDHSLAIPKAILKFRETLKIDCFEIHSIIIEDVDFNDVTERYMISVDFSDTKIDFDKIKKELNKEYKNSNISDKKSSIKFIYLIIF